MPSEVDDWDELHRVIGEVTVNMTEIESSLDFIIVDQIMTDVAMERFVRRHVLARMSISEKVRILRAYTKEYADQIVDPEGARELLTAVESASQERNRLVHDLHDETWDGGGISRKHLWEWDEDGVPVDLSDYRRLAMMTERLAKSIDADLGGALHPG